MCAVTHLQRPHWYEVKYMQYLCGANLLELVPGDICHQKVDAIVNAANDTLSFGGGVCGAIHRAAGPELTAACAQIGHCATGDSCITPGFRLEAKYVIHAVGPMWHSRSEDAVLLQSAYRSALALAQAHGIESIAFPAISTGIFGYPLDEAASIAIRTVAQFLEQQDQVKLVRFVFLNDETFTAFRYAARRQLASAEVHAK
jgi:O-acetyl-ADP-ribose deacetylase (regulator of RNase III)